MSKIHIAGFPVQIGSKYRQRCAWCEAVLIDGDMADEMTITSDGQPPRGPSTYEMGALIEVIADGPCTQSAVIPHVDGDALPANACIGPPKLRAVPDCEGWHQHEGEPCEAHPDAPMVRKETP